MQPAATSTPLVVVTGASSGIGAAFARELVLRGYEPVLVGRDAGRLRAVAASLAARSQVLVADLSRPDDVARVAAFVGDGPRPPALLVNNAAVGWYGRFAENDPDRLTETVAVNVTAVVRLTRAALPAMVAAGSGGVLNVSSLASRFPQRGMATYVGTKAFMDSWTRSIRAELAGTGVVVTCVRPSWVRTDFHRRSGVPVADVLDDEWSTADEVVRRALDAHAQNRAFVSVPRDPRLRTRASWLARSWLADRVQTRWSRR